MSVAVYSEWLSAFGADRAAKLIDEGIVSDIYAYVGPDNEAARANRAEWDAFRAKLGRDQELLGLQVRYPLWGWYACSADQERDVAEITRLHDELEPDGWLLDIEKPLEGAYLTTLVRGVAALGKPVRASCAGANPNHYLYGHRTLDRYGVEVEWQCYLDSGEGPPPDVAVRELYTPSRLHLGHAYRAATWPRDDRSRVSYGWGHLVLVDAQWGYWAWNRRVWLAGDISQSRTGWPMLVRHSDTLSSMRYQGRLLGLARYSRIRVALDVTRGAAERRSLAEWTALSASARVPVAARRPVSVYLAEVCPDDVLWAIAEGAG